MRVVFRRAAVVAGAAAVVLGSVTGIASAARAPVISWSPATSAGIFDFGIVTPGTTTTPQTFSLTNTGGSGTAALTVTVSGSAFALSADTCTGRSLRPRASCTVQVTYAAGTAGQTDTGALNAAGHKTAASDTTSLTLRGAESLCTAGSDNFNEDYGGSQPTTFSGGTMTGYNTSGGIEPYPGPIQEAGFSDNVVYSGGGSAAFTVTFTHAVKSLSLSAGSEAVYGTATLLTLTGYDASNNVVDSVSTSNWMATTLSLSSPTADIAYFRFTQAPTDPNASGVMFTDMTWGC